jgi:hypothetical protein
MGKTNLSGRQWVFANDRRGFLLYSERRNHFLADAETIARFQRANVNQVN